MKCERCNEEAIHNGNFVISLLRAVLRVKRNTQRPDVKTPDTISRSRPHCADQSEFYRRSEVV